MISPARGHWAKTSRFPLRRNKANGQIRSHVTAGYQSDGISSARENCMCANARINREGVAGFWRRRSSLPGKVPHSAPEIFLVEFPHPAIWKSPYRYSLRRLKACDVSTSAAYSFSSRSLTRRRKSPYICDLRKMDMRPDGFLPDIRWARNQKHRCNCFIAPFRLEISDAA